MRFKNSQIFWAPALLVYCVFITFYLGNAYVGGDKGNYDAYYLNLSQTWSLSEVVFLTFAELGAAEPIFILVYFISSKLIPKEVFDLTSNLILLVLIFHFNAKYSRYKNLSLIYILINFYTFVVFLPAEKLKLSLIFLMSLSFIFSKHIAAVSLVASIVHFQFILKFLIDFISSIKLKLSIPVNLRSILLAVISLVLLSFLYERIINKFLFYLLANDKILIDIAKVGFWGF